MAGVEGGPFVADGYRGPLGPRLPLPLPPSPMPIVILVNVLPPRLAAGGTIGPGLYAANAESPVGEPGPWFGCRLSRLGGRYRGRFPHPAP
jgi:hypothetical protein